MDDDSDEQTPEEREMHEMREELNRSLREIEDHFEAIHALEKRYTKLKKRLEDSGATYEPSSPENSSTSPSYDPV